MITDEPISARRALLVAKPPDVTVAIRNGDLIGPSELFTIFGIHGCEAGRVQSCYCRCEGCVEQWVNGSGQTTIRAQRI